MNSSHFFWPERNAKGSWCDSLLKAWSTIPVHPYISRPEWMNSFFYKVQRILFQQVQIMLLPSFVSTPFILDCILVGFIHNQNPSWGSLSFDTQVKLIWTSSMGCGSLKSFPSFWWFWVCVCDREKLRHWDREQETERREHEYSLLSFFCIQGSVSATLMDHLTIPLVHLGSIVLQKGAEFFPLIFP